MPVTELRRSGTSTPGHRPCVDVWTVPLAVDDATVAHAATQLTASERARADRGTPAVRRRRIILRWALRTVAARHLSCAPGEVPLRVTALGRPLLDLPDGRLDVSCTARGPLGLVALARDQRIGVDLEVVTPWCDTVLEEGWLTPAERRALLRLHPRARAEAAARCWTGKEAVLKASGSGLTVSPAAVGPVVGRGSGQLAGWALSDVTVPRGYVATLASSARSRPGTRLRRRRRSLAPRPFEPPGRT